MIAITLTQNKVAYIDDSDVEFASYAWQYDQHTGYAKRKFTIEGKRVTKYLHRMVFEKHNSIELLKSELVDHENNNRLDCTTKNLRLADYSQNAANKHSKGNKSGYKWVTVSGLTFTAAVTFRGVTHVSRGFETALEAHEWALNKANELQGEFAKV